MTGENDFFRVFCVNLMNNILSKRATELTLLLVCPWFRCGLISKGKDSKADFYSKRRSLLVSLKEISVLYLYYRFCDAVKSSDDIFCDICWIKCASIGVSFPSIRNESFS